MEPASVHDRVESLVFVLLNALLAGVLVAALAAGGREVMNASAKPAPDRDSEITAPAR